MVESIHSVELTKTAEAVAITTTYGQSISIRGTNGDTVHLHFGGIMLHGEDARADALAALDTLAAAVQTAMLALAPERFPQPGPDDPDDDPTDEPVSMSRVVDAAVLASGGASPSEAVAWSGDLERERIVNAGAGVTLDSHAPIVVHEPWGEGEGDVLDAATILRHGIEGQLRAAYGDR